MARRLVNVIAADATAGYFKAEVVRPHLFYLASHPYYTTHLKKNALMINSQDISTK